MKKNRIIEYIFLTIFCLLLFFNLFVRNSNIQKYLLLVFLPIYTIVSTMFLKTKKIANIHKNNVILLIIGFAVIYVAFLYVLGFIVGFYRNSTPLNIANFLTRILPYIIIVVCSEYIRKTFIIKNNRKITIFITIELIIVEITTYLGLYKMFTLEEILALFGYVGLSAVSTNIFCNYMVKRYGVIPNIIYRITTTIYIYIFAVLPDVSLFFQSVYRVTYPYVMYLIIDGMYEKNRIKQAKKNNKSSTISLIICTVLMLLIVMLVSCKFKYGIMVIASSSMTDYIKKGDAVVFEQYKNQQLEEGQVIIFYNENIRTVHRIIDIQTKNDETIYYTKGDNNPQQDKGYRTKKEIVGIVNSRILYLGWGTIWLNELFNR